MPTWLKWILDFLWEKLIPPLINWIKNLFKKKQIDNEVDKEEDEIEKIRQEIFKYMQESGDERVPDHLEKKLRDALAKRNDGLSSGL